MINIVTSATSTNQQTSNNVVNNQVNIAAPAQFGKFSFQATCPFCNTTDYTVAQSECGFAELLICLLCWLLCWPVALCVACCSNWFATFSDTVHYCRKCNGIIGISKRF